MARRGLLVKPLSRRAAGEQALFPAPANRFDRQPSAAPATPRLRPSRSDTIRLAARDSITPLQHVFARYLAHGFAVCSRSWLIADRCACSGKREIDPEGVLLLTGERLDICCTRPATVMAGLRRIAVVRATGAVSRKRSFAARRQMAESDGNPDLARRWT